MILKNHFETVPYCKVCGEYKSNERFSGNGHAAHICKKCVALSAVQRSEEIKTPYFGVLFFTLTRKCVILIKKQAENKCHAGERTIWYNWLL